MKPKLILTIICCALVAGLTGCDIVWRSFKKYDCRASAVPNPKTFRDFITASRYHFDFGEFECAYTAAEQALRLKTGDAEAAEALNARGYAHFGFKEYGAALSDFQSSLWLDANNPKTYFARSLVYAARSEQEEASKRFDDARADQIDALKNLNEALRLAENDPKFRSSLPGWKNQRGFLRFKTGDAAGALEDISAAIRLAPEDAFHYDDRAWLYRQIGKTSEAEADERKSAELKAAAELRKAATGKN